jgi:hypothetical protein
VPLYVWAITRPVLLLAAMRAVTPDGALDAASDVGLYARYADAILAGARAYVDVPIEYPPGSLPLIVGPGIAGSGLAYLVAFLVLCALLDLGGLLAVRRLAHRWGGELGIWVWVVGPALLGPISYLRLDLLPVVAVLWAVERAAAERWGASGAWLAFGAVAKLYPAALAVPAIVAAPRRLRVIAGLGIICGLGLLTSLQVLPAMLQTVLGYHLQRGLQVESTWASALLVADLVGLTDVEVEFAFGAHQVAGPAIGAVGGLARIAVVGSVALGALVAARRKEEGARGMARALGATTLLLLVAASVLSVQYLLWAVGAMAAVACLPRVATPRQLGLLAAAVALTALEYPRYYDALTLEGAAGVVIVALRNAALVWLAASVTRRALHRPD